MENQGGVSFNTKLKRLDVEVDFERGSVFPHEDEDGEIRHYKAYDTVKKSWRHLNFFEHECYLNVRVPRVQPQKGCVRMILPPWAGNLHGFTLLMEAFILQLCKNMPVNQVGKILKVSDHRIWKMLECYVEKGSNLADYKEVKTVGVDETSLKKNHNYIGLFVDLEEKRTLYVAEGKDHSIIEEFAEFMEEKDVNREQITNISCDMSPAFIKGVRLSLPKAKITFDKFHIMKIINEGVDQVRKDEAKENPILKKTRYIFLKNNENLTTFQRKQKEKLKNLNLRSIQALHLRENFQEIYKAESFEKFEFLLQEWYDWAIGSELEPMIRVANTIKAHWDGILQWRKTNLNNAILEGLNSVVQAAKRNARGYQFQHFRIITLLITGKLNFQGINPFLPTHF